MEYIDMRKVGKEGFKQIRSQVVRLKKMDKRGKEIEEIVGLWCCDWRGCSTILPRPQSPLSNGCHAAPRAPPQSPRHASGNIHEVILPPRTLSVRPYPNTAKAASRALCHITALCDDKCRTALLRLRWTHGQFNLVHLGIDGDVF